MGNSPRDCGPGGQWLGFMFIWWGIVLMGSCPRTDILYNLYKRPLASGLILCSLLSGQPPVNGSRGAWANIRQLLTVMIAMECMTFWVSR